ALQPAHGSRVPTRQRPETDARPDPPRDPPPPHPRRQARSLHDAPHTGRGSRPRAPLPQAARRGGEAARRRPLPAGTAPQVALHVGQAGAGISCVGAAERFEREEHEESGWGGHRRCGVL
ncbi:hypothetical protein E4U41_000206, partial [Claviceps citrina]